MSKIAATFTVLMLVLAGSAFAQDYRSPDAKPPVVAKQDFRSPDAKQPPALQDFRSPDARPGQAIGTAAPQVEPDASSSFDWGYLVLGIATALIGVAALLVTQRRRRHGLAIGS
jgi:hypothetical protein